MKSFHFFTRAIFPSLMRAGAMRYSAGVSYRYHQLDQWQFREEPTELTASGED